MDFEMSRCLDQVIWHVLHDSWIFRTKPMIYIYIHHDFLHFILLTSCYHLLLCIYGDIQGYHNPSSFKNLITPWRHWYLATGEGALRALEAQMQMIRMMAVSIGKQMIIGTWGVRLPSFQQSHSWFMMIHCILFILIRLILPWMIHSCCEE